MKTTKREIINNYLDENFSRCTPTMRRQLFKVLFKLNEVEFIDVVEHTYNWKLDPIRKHQYLVR